MWIMLNNVTIFASHILSTTFHSILTASLWERVPKKATRRVVWIVAFLYQRSTGAVNDTSPCSTNGGVTENKARTQSLTCSDSKYATDNQIQVSWFVSIFRSSTHLIKGYKLMWNLQHVIDILSYIVWVKSALKSGCFIHLYWICVFFFPPVD